MWPTCLGQYGCTTFGISWRGGGGRTGGYVAYLYGECGS